MLSLWSHWEEGSVLLPLHGVCVRGGGGETRQGYILLKPKELQPAGGAAAESTGRHDGQSEVTQQDKETPQRATKVQK